MVKEDKATWKSNYFLKLVVSIVILNAYGMNVGKPMCRDTHLYIHTHTHTHNMQ